jgi:hypothetical protein
LGNGKDLAALNGPNHDFKDDGLVHRMAWTPQALHHGVDIAPR